MLEDISYFNGLFSDIDNEYRAFHDKALTTFLEESNTSKVLSKKILCRVVDRMAEFKKDIILTSKLFVQNVRIITEERLLKDIANFIMD